MKCSTCGSNAVFIDCKYCDGTGEVEYVEGPIIGGHHYYGDCEMCDGTGKVAFCETCNVSLCE